MYAYSLIIVILLGITFLGSRSQAQVILQPGQAIPMCETRAAITGGGTVCTFNARESRIEISHQNQDMWLNFWGSGDAQSLLPSICTDTQATSIVESVRAPELRIRTIDCGSGESSSWTQRSNDRSNLMCEEVHARSRNLISCSYEPHQFTLLYRNRYAYRGTRWSGQHDNLLGFLCTFSLTIREKVPGSRDRVHQCREG